MPICFLCYSQVCYSSVERNPSGAVNHVPCRSVHGPVYGRVSFELG